MKARNGGKGLTDVQVKSCANSLPYYTFALRCSPSRFIDRYIPGYVFFSEGIQNGYVDIRSSLDQEDKQPKWKGNGLKLILDEERALVVTSAF